jgi:WD40 repeat protein
MVNTEQQPAKNLAITQILTVANWSADALVGATIAPNSSRFDYISHSGSTSTAFTIGTPPEDSGRRREPPQPLQGRLLSVDYSTDGSRIVSAGEDGTVRQWEANSGRAIGEPLQGHQGPVLAPDPYEGFLERLGPLLSVDYSADGSRIVSAGMDGTVRQWEANSGRAIGEPLQVPQ